MQKYCRTCPDKYSEICALPSVTNRIFKTAGVLGAFIFEGCARVGAAAYGKAIESDSTGLISTTTELKDAIHIPAEACVWLHMQAD